ncbi:GGDEF domain-containing protein [Pseudomonas abieticivorans]|uniref:GGDEF domain-containing protein n=1 Tax=Pseudomonas abieticivorans TaxID=2931382 RepID=UPI0020BDD445|nr:diguanylate cyclase [Pseudomonas sp. PIA16]
MPNPNLSIVLVNDDPLACETLQAQLAQAGYLDIRSTPHDKALNILEPLPASLLLVAGDAGLALAAQVRQFDEMSDHYSYILLISDRPAAELLDETADLGIDEVVAPKALDSQLLQRVFAADRLCNIVQRLRQENRLLRQNIASLEQRNLVDSLTGLGNARYLRQKLTDSLRQVQARGGAICYLLIGIEQADALQREHGSDFYDELLQGIARRLQQMVRPLDVLARLDDQHFVLLTLPADLQECAPSSFKRLHDGLNLKGFQTRAGLIEIAAGISLVGLDSKSLPIDPQVLFDEACVLLDESYATHLVSAKRLPAKA